MSERSLFDDPRLDKDLSAISRQYGIDLGVGISIDNAGVDYVTDGTIASPVARATDPGTSHQAAASVKNIKQTQDRILGLLLKIGPMSDDQIGVEYAKQYGFETPSPSGLRTRRSELQHLGLVMNSGNKVVKSSGRKAIIWEAVKR